MLNQLPSRPANMYFPTFTGYIFVLGLLNRVSENSAFEGFFSFFLTWTIFKVFIEFGIMLFLFYVLAF